MYNLYCFTQLLQSLVYLGTIIDLQRNPIYFWRIPFQIITYTKLIMWIISSIATYGNYHIGATTARLNSRFSQNYAGRNFQGLCKSFHLEYFNIWRSHLYLWRAYVGLSLVCWHKNVTIKFLITGSM